LKGISQTASTSDSTFVSIPANQLKKAINIIEKSKVTQKELDFTKEKVVNLDKIIIGKDYVIKEHETKEGVFKNIIGDLNKTIKNLDEVTINLEKKSSIQQREIRKQKWKKWGTLLAGVGVGYLAFR
jgi:Zn-dependent metalloprotease